MLQVIATRENELLDRKADYRQWHNLVRCFNATVELLKHDDIPTRLSECLNSSTIVIFDETADTDLEDFKHPEDAIYVFGKSNQMELQKTHANHEAVKITTPDNKSMYGISAAAIVLYHRLKNDSFN